MQKVEKYSGQKNHTAIISIDIQVAFGNLTHKSVEEKLTKNNCPGKIKTQFSNLKDRKVIFPSYNGVAQHTQTRGCPQRASPLEPGR
ncbi:hypothetical protein AVEN_64256-1 [Araneus ventricosus]|uniref:Reverse transcriptase domain-containing protein n=1 Tax=Araneus ventricosus TaxID=182803 RepID=A0A4Y2SDG8_ARAVE|nr:hypothetical protein AVEN_64256-1 [Araneus ventricosus]